ncbi:MAG: phosphatase PAP2 family protein [Chthoniobacterales bacterium]
MTSALLPQNCVPLAMVNPLLGPDHGLANWFHAHLTQHFVTFLRALSEPGSAEWIGFVVFCGVLFFVWKKHWLSLATLVVAVPGGMLLNELVKILVHRPRPFLTGQFVDWSGYSFASGHTIGATLLYGQLALFLVPFIKGHRRRRLAICGAAVIVLLVGFSRIALGAHYLSDVLAAMLFGSGWLTICLFATKPIRRQPVLPATVTELEAAVLVPVEEREVPAEARLS